MKRKWKQWTAFLCLLMLLAASLHLARAESALTQEECAPYRIVLTAPGGWNRSNSAIITVSVKDEQNLGWYQMAYRMNDGDWTDCEQLFDKSKAEKSTTDSGVLLLCAVYLSLERRLSASLSVSSRLAKCRRTMLLIGSLKNELPGTAATPIRRAISSQKSTSL